MKYVSLKLPHPLEQKMIIRVYCDGIVDVKELFDKAIGNAKSHLDELQRKIDDAFQNSSA